VLVKREGGNGWLLTAFETRPDTAAGSATRPSATQADPIRSRDSLGAGNPIVSGDDTIRFSRAREILDKGGEAAAKLDNWLDRKRAVPQEWTAQQQAAAAKFDTFSPRQPVASYIRQAKERFAGRAVQKIFDQFRPLKNLSEEAFMQAHLSKATDGALEAVVTHGLPRLRDGALAVQKQAGGGFFGALSRLGDAREVNQFLMWVAAHRAEKLLAEGRENLFTPEDIAAMKQFAQGSTAAGKKRSELYRETHKRLQEYNRAILDIAEEAGLVGKEGRAQWESEFYLPFYRVRDDGPPDFSAAAQGLARQDVIRQLKGGT